MMRAAGAAESRQRGFSVAAQGVERRLCQRVEDPKRARRSRVGAQRRKAMTQQPLAGFLVSHGQHQCGEIDRRFQRREIKELHSELRRILEETGKAITIPVQRFGVAAGLDVRQSVLERGVSYLEAEIVEEEDRHDMQAWMLHALSVHHAEGRRGVPRPFQATAFDNLWKDRRQLNAYTRALLAAAFSIEVADAQDGEASS